MKRYPELAGLQLLAGDALRDRSRHAEAVEQFREFLKSSPNLADALGNLGFCLLELKRLHESVEVCRKALAINDRIGWVRNNPGCALRDQGKLDEAILEFKWAIEIDPKYANPYQNLGFIYRYQATYAESLKYFRLGLEANPGSQELKTGVVEAERFVELEQKLDDLLSGQVEAKDPAEKIALANIASKKDLHLASVRLRLEAFTAEPALADPVKHYSRYNGACSAALAAAGKAKDDAPPPDEAARIELRQQALTWLRDDLIAWTKVVETGSKDDRTRAVAQLEHRKSDTDLAGIRGEPAISLLPEAERDAFRSLWADVDRLIARGRANK